MFQIFKLFIYCLFFFIISYFETFLYVYDDDNYANKYQQQSAIPKQQNCEKKSNNLFRSR